MADRHRTVRLVVGLVLLFGALALFTGVVTLVSPTVTLALAGVDLVFGVWLLASARNAVTASTPAETR